jgi:signal transduction histidine kinase
LHLQPDLPAVRGVSGELNLVWRHLVDNAIDAVPERGQVAVTAVAENGAVVVKVTDNGAGIAEQDRGRIFEPFFTTKTVGQGAGLGLDVVQSVVKSHSGSIEVRSSPGRTEFQVSLPAVGAGRP